MEPDPVGNFRLAGAPRDGRPRWMPQLVGPAVPARSEALREGAEDRVLPKGVSLLAHELIELGVTPAADAAPHRLEGFRFQREDRVAIDQRIAIQRLALADPLGERLQLSRARQIGDPEEERIAEQPAGREVRTGLLRQERRRRSQRVDHRDPRAL